MEVPPLPPTSAWSSRARLKLALAVRTPHPRTAPADTARSHGSRPSHVHAHTGAPRQTIADATHAPFPSRPATTKARHLLELHRACILQARGNEREWACKEQLCGKEQHAAASKPTNTNRCCRTGGACGMREPQPIALPSRVRPDSIGVAGVKQHTCAGTVWR